MSVSLEVSIDTAQAEANVLRLNDYCQSLAENALKAREAVQYLTCIDLPGVLQPNQIAEVKNGDVMSIRNAEHYELKATKAIIAELRTREAEYKARIETLTRQNAGILASARNHKRKLSAIEKVLKC